MMKASRFLPLVIFLPLLSCSDKNQAPQLGEAPVKEVVAAMTPEEKVKLIIGMGMNYDGIPDGILPPADPEDAKVPEKVPGAAGRTHAIPRLGIPSIVLSDGPAGVRISPKRKGNDSTFYATAFPTATLLASSWDTTLVRKVGEAFGSEVRDYGIDILLAPGMNIHRNPLGGRNFEYYSEDPVIAGNMAAYFVNGIQSNNVGTSIKHFAANNQEFNRMQLNTHVSERALREIYLKGFEIAVTKSHPWTVMSSYNLINGTYASESRDLLTTVLRDEWGFKGFVMTDWFGGKNVVAQINAGNDMIMPGTTAQTEDLMAAVKNGKVSPAQLDENVERILNIILKSPSFNKYAYSDKPDLKKDAGVSRMAAAEGMVLLKNNADALPLTTGKKVALFGNTSYNLIAGGTGSGDVNKQYVISLHQGLANAGYAPEASLQAAYQKYIADEKAKQPKAAIAFFAPKPIAEMPVTGALLQNEAANTDIAIVTIGRNAGEGGDRQEADDFDLTFAERQNLKQIAAAYHAKSKKVVVVLNIGGVTEIASWRDNADAILLAWQPGLEGGNAIADILSGKVNPSGKLATTFPVKYSDVPSAKTFPGKLLNPDDKTPANPLMGKPAEVTYDEGIYVGYRYYNTFNIKPAYEFGYGLSYTTFAYSNLVLSDSKFNGKSLEAKVTVTNSGKVAGKEVAQLYISAPVKDLNKPAIELKGFAKTILLRPGESATLTFTINAADLASYDPNQAAWVADAGAYTVKIGASSLNIKQTAGFELAQAIKAAKLKHVLTPLTLIKELKK
ncbi:beta-glucosidase [Mucilaginibacter gynuensis]|uniref:Beta-glucosidase n=1 Tax=Mucilaginibacter gynuensis TaxID=1302236 RepID=A0ABP8G9S0_9SPHI